MQSSVLWNLPNSPGSRSGQNRNPFHVFGRVASIADFHHSWSRSTSASSSSSSSYDPDFHTSTASSKADIASPTPTPTISNMSSSSIPYRIKPETSYATSPTNPWAKIIAAQESTSSASPDSSSLGGSPSPETQSRASTPTPIAPIPMKPFTADSKLLSPRDEFHPLYPFIPIEQATHAGGGGIPYTVGFDDKLHVQLITLELITQQNRRIPQICIRQQWKSSQSQMIYQWAIKHYRTACLLWMADDLAAWPKAVVMGLEDKNLPYTEQDLIGLAKDPTRVCELQWKVAIKQLPRSGSHTEFATKDVVPLETHPKYRMNLPESQKKIPKRMDCVKFCDKTTDVIYVRKRLDIKHGREKEAILSQIRDFHRISQKNIAKIIGSYAKGQTVAILSERIEANLVDYLENSMGPSDAEQLLTWMTDLGSALKYLHENGFAHRSIRPNKILVDPVRCRISFSAFGITQPARAPGTALFAPYSDDPAYIYAAPETISLREANYAADIFSFGCVLLEMATTAKGIDLEVLEAYRSSVSHDSSYHMNLERIDSWAQQLKNSKAGMRSRRDRHGAAIEHVLLAVRVMVSADPERRPGARRVSSHLDKGAATQAARRPRRRSDVGAEIGRAIVEQDKGKSTDQSRSSDVWVELESLDSYYQAGQGGSLSGLVGDNALD